MIIDDFIKYEEESKLFELEIYGFKYWHYLRRVIFDQILEQKNQIGQAHTNHKNVPYYKRVSMKLFQMRNWFLKNPFYLLRKKDVLVFNHPRRVKNGENYECIYTDGLLKEIDKSYYVFEQPMLEKHFKPVGTKNLRFLDYLNFKVAVYVEINRKFLRFSFDEIEKNKILTVIKEIENYFDVSIDEKNLFNILEIDYLSYKPMRKYYNKILDKIKPKVIVELVSYIKDKYVINELAKERGIPIIELQHGTMGKYHIAYNFEKKMELPTFPDYIFTFSQFWKDNTRLPIKDNKVKVVGWPFFEKKINESQIKKINSKTTILFISQGTIGRELSKIAVEISKILDENTYRIIYKLHPGEYARWKREYPWLVGAALEVVDDNENDMHYYFAQSNIQVGVYSTALFEGLGYGLKTFICKLYGHKYMEELYNNDYAVLVDNSSIIIQNIRDNFKVNSKFDRQYFWENDSLNRMISNINLIIDNKGYDNEHKKDFQ